MLGFAAEEVLNFNLFLLLDSLADSIPTKDRQTDLLPPREGFPLVVVALDGVPLPLHDGREVGWLPVLDVVEAGVAVEHVGPAVTS